MRSYTLIGPFKCSQLRSRVREQGAACSSINQKVVTNVLLPNLLFSVIKIRIYHSRLLKGEERHSKSRRKKKKHGAVSPSCVQLQVLLSGPAAMIVVALHAKDYFKKALNNKLWQKEHSICTLLMIHQTLIPLVRGQPKLTKLWKKRLAIIAHTYSTSRFTQVTLKAQSHWTQRTECTSYCSLRFSITLLLPPTCRNIWE